MNKVISVCVAALLLSSCAVLTGGGGPIRYNEPYAEGVDAVWECHTTQGCRRVR